MAARRQGGARSRIGGASDGESSASSVERAAPAGYRESAASIDALGRRVAEKLHTLGMELRCGVCYSLYADPVFIPCGHTFCKVRARHLSVAITVADASA